MTRIKQPGLAVLLAFGLTVATSSPTMALEGTITLTNTADARDQDQNASGQATLTDVTYGILLDQFTGYEPIPVFYGSLTLTCQGLTPGATYRVGPTGVAPYVYKFRGEIRLYYVAYYSYVTASPGGTVELALPVESFASPDGYWLYLDRQKGRKYTPVLIGLFP